MIHHAHSLRFAMLAVLLSAARPAVAHEVPGPHAETEANRRIVTRAFDRWQEGTGNFFQEVLHPEVVWTITGSGPSAGTYHGQQALLDGAVTPFTARLKGPVRPVEKQVFADGDHVIIHWQGRAEARDDQTYDNRYAWILKMEDGKAAAVTAFLDLAPYDAIFDRIPGPARR
ncbi:nuclear transport factor 2 family protein [Rhizobium sp. YIM 134829]|uniref:nuclear transport factor 2 family protein n=1 Tax=Rhizobium sp. YIM 134829 TaxID=3390453 RepID=UPI00397B3FFD